MPNNLYDKIWNNHLVDQQDDGTALLFVDRHLVHEVTSPQAFEGLRNSNRKVRRPKNTFAVAKLNDFSVDKVFDNAKKGFKTFQTVMNYVPDKVSDTLHKTKFGQKKDKALDIARGSQA